MFFFANFTDMTTQGLTRTQITLMAITAGICVANIYYNQPILKEIADSFQVTESQIGAIAVLTQAGYGFGLFFITPMGDMVNRKKLILVLQGLLILALLALAATTNLMAVFGLSLLIGMTAIIAQVILPMAASLDKVNRGRTVGIIFTGILVGVLGARVFSGYIAEWFGWRYVYGISSVLVLGTSVIVYTALPDAPLQFTGSYGQLLKSTLLQIKRFALLRRTALLGAVVFGVFCSFWTTITFYLSGPPFNYGADIIGLFGILAIAGAMLAPVFGKLADKGNPGRSQLVTTIMIIVSVLLIKFFPFNIGSFVLAVLLLDVGVQATQVTNVATIYMLDDTAHSRINTVYMTTYFLGGAIGTFAGVKCWQSGGWQLVTTQLLAWSCIALLIVLTGNRIKSKQKHKEEQILS